MNEFKKNNTMVDKGIQSLIEFLKKLQKNTSYGANGKDFENSIKSILINGGFIEASFDSKEQSKFIINHITNLNKKEFNRDYYDKIKNMVVNDKNNVEILVNPLNNFFNENIYIYISTIW